MKQIKYLVIPFVIALVTIGVITVFRFIICWKCSGTGPEVLIPIFGFVILYLIPALTLQVNAQTTKEQKEFRQTMILVSILLVIYALYVILFERIGLDTLIKSIYTFLHIHQ